MQRHIVNQYTLFELQQSVPYTKISDAGFRNYLQFEGDGIILYVLSMIRAPRTMPVFAADWLPVRTDSYFRVRGCLLSARRRFPNAWSGLHPHGNPPVRAAAY